VLAATLRMPVGLLNNLLLTMIAVTVAVSMQIVGVALMVAMLVTPAATAYLLTRRMWTMMLIAASIGATSAVVGMYLSYHLNIASGAAIVLTATAVFIVVFLFNPRQGVLRK
jgi:ABC-type Mn2+/Zn2+ transport system permease subunit